MLEAFIIDKLRKKKEETDKEWAPLPLQLPILEPDPNDNPEQDKEDDTSQKTVIHF